MHSPFQWAKACVTGASHRACGALCQDAIAIRPANSRDHRQHIIAAVADGAGSAIHGGRGAKIAAHTFADTVAGMLGKSDRPDLLHIAKLAAGVVHTVVRRQALRTGSQCNDYASTLLACVTDGRKTAVVQIGDGAIVLGPRWQVVFTPQRGEYANFTKFITEDDALEVLQARQISGRLGSISLMSDGLEPLVVKPPRSVHPPLFEHLTGAFHQIRRRGHVAGLSRQLEGLLAGPLVQNETGDDASLITIALAEGG